MPGEDKKELATEGLTRPGEYVVRKGHYVLEPSESRALVPQSHRINPRAATGREFVFFIVRDPRDIAVSAKHYFEQGSQDITTAIGWMGQGTGPFRSIGPWQRYVLDWMQETRICAICASYERLLNDPVEELTNLLKIAEFPVIETKLARIERAILAEAFETKKHRLLVGRPNQADLIKNHMRKGGTGDWRNEFTDKDRKLALHYFADQMRLFGYER